MTVKPTPDCANKRPKVLVLEGARGNAVMIEVLIRAEFE